MTSLIKVTIIPAMNDPRQADSADTFQKTRSSHFFSMVRLARGCVRLLHGLVLAAGVVFITFLILCWTSVPWTVYCYFTKDPVQLQQPPDYIVILGGGGIPSESGLVRAYHGAGMARVFTNAQVVVCLPSEGDLYESALGKMKEELVLHGVKPGRILLEDQGLNTRGQALGVLELLGEDARDSALLLVTSPDHTKRSLLTFRKLGFSNAAGSAAFQEAVKADVRYESKSLGGSQGGGPDIGSNLRVRYLFWSNLNYLSGAFREAAALMYYRMRGWV